MCTITFRPLADGKYGRLHESKTGDSQTTEPFPEYSESSNGLASRISDSFTGWRTDLPISKPQYHHASRFYEMPLWGQQLFPGTLLGKQRLIAELLDRMGMAGWSLEDLCWGWPWVGEENVNFNRPKMTKTALFGDKKGDSAVEIIVGRSAAAR